jgi:hypothetical protein
VKNKNEKPRSSLTSIAMGATHGLWKIEQTATLKGLNKLYNKKTIGILSFNPVGVFTILYFITMGCTHGYGCSTLKGLGLLVIFGGVFLNATNGTLLIWKMISS